jgi:hypothetical protein
LHFNSVTTTPHCHHHHQTILTHSLRLFPSLSSVINIVVFLSLFVLRWSAVKAIVVLACSAAPSGSTVVVATIIADKSNVIAVGASYHGMTLSRALRCS